MDLDGNKETVRRAYEEAWNRKNVDALDELLPEDYDMHRGEKTGGRAAIKAIIAGYHRAFPDLRVTMHEFVAEGDRVCVRLTWQGTHLGELQTAYGVIPPTGKAVTWSGNHFFRIENGRLAESHYGTDALSLYQQVGAVPTPDLS
ncbi:MAG: ester cyclase [Fimbriimonadales bacterium]